MGEKRKTTVYFGGEASELWTEHGLRVSYTGAVPVVAVEEGDGSFRAEAPEPQRAGDVKAGYNELARCLELAVRLNAGAVSPLSRAYFLASAEIALALEGTEDWRSLPERWTREVCGGAEGIALIELLRRLLDDLGADWEGALETVSRCFTLRLNGAAIAAPVPTAAVSALQQRDATLINAVNERLCSRLWEAWPGDWLRIGENAAVRDAEADFTLLAAFLCSRVYCTKEALTGSLRALYTLDPARFTEV